MIFANKVSSIVVKKLKIIEREGQEIRLRKAVKLKYLIGKLKKRRRMSARPGRSHGQGFFIKKTENKPRNNLGMVVLRKKQSK